MLTNTAHQPAHTLDIVAALVAQPTAGAPAGNPAGILAGVATAESARSKAALIGAAASQASGYGTRVAEIATLAGLTDLVLASSLDEDDRAAVLDGLATLIGRLVDGGGDPRRALINGIGGLLKVAGSGGALGAALRRLLVDAARGVPLNASILELPAAA